MKRSDITPELCRQLLRYEAETGKLFWRPRPENAAWSACWGGKEAFTANNNDGYRVGRIKNILFRAHRVAWAIVYGQWPNDQLDHVDGDKGNNRLANLREVNNQQNQRNVRLTKNNTSGICGVHTHGRKWMARIGVDGEQRYLGVFSTIDEAAAARRKAAIQFGFTEQHGNA